MTKTKDYSVLLEGVDAHDLPLSVLRELCDFLVEGAQRSARLLAEGRSTARGAAPAWLVSAADLRVSRFETGSLDFGLRAPVLSEIAPESFTDADATAFDLFLDAASDAAAGNKESERLDAGVLEVLVRTAVLFAEGGTRLHFSRQDKPPVVIEPAHAAVIKKMSEETPSPSVCRVSGLLDALTISSRTLELRLEDGRILRGFASRVDLGQLKQLLGTQVVLEGPVTFRPSGEALRFEVDFAESATPGDPLWVRMPSRGRISAHPLVIDDLFGERSAEQRDETLLAAARKAVS